MSFYFILHFALIYHILHQSLDGVVVVFEKDGRVAVDTSEGSSVVVIVVVDAV